MFDACEDANQISTSSSRHLPELVEAIRVNGDESTGCLTLRRPSGEQVQRCRGGPPGGPGLEASEWSFSVPDELLRSIALHEPEAAYLVAHLGRVSREERFIYLRPVLAKYVVPIPSKHYELELGSAISGALPLNKGQVAAPSVRSATLKPLLTGSDLMMYRLTRVSTSGGNLQTIVLELHAASSVGNVRNFEVQNWYLE
jgi:hypothetical protein